MGCCIAAGQGLPEIVVGHFAEPATMAFEYFDELARLVLATGILVDIFGDLSAQAASLSQLVLLTNGISS